MVEGPQISIVIPVYNQASFLSSSIESCIRQTYPRVEIIVVDDGSTDNAREVATNYPIKYIYQRNKGVSAAMNKGVMNTTGEFFCCLGADDLLHPLFIELCLEKMFSSESNGYVWTGTRIFGTEDKIDEPVPLIWRYSVFRPPGGQIGCALIRRKAYDEVGGYDEKLRMNEDSDMMIRIALKGWRCKSVGQPIYYLRKHSNSQLTSLAQRHKLYLNLVRKYPVIPIYSAYARIFYSIIKLIRSPRASLNKLNLKAKHRLTS